MRPWPLVLILLAGCLDGPAPGPVEAPAVPAEEVWQAAMVQGRAWHSGAQLLKVESMELPSSDGYRPADAEPGDGRSAIWTFTFQHAEEAVEIDVAGDGRMLGSRAGQDWNARQLSPLRVGSEQAWQAFWHLHEGQMTEFAARGPPTTAAVAAQMGDAPWWILIAVAGGHAEAEAPLLRAFVDGVTGAASSDFLFEADMGSEWVHAGLLAPERLEVEVGSSHSGLSFALSDGFPVAPSTPGQALRATVTDPDGATHVFEWQAGLEERGSVAVSPAPVGTWQVEVAAVPAGLSGAMLSWCAEAFWGSPGIPACAAES